MQNKRTLDQMEQESKSQHSIDIDIDNDTPAMIRQWSKTDITQLISKGQSEVCKFLQSHTQYIEICVDYLIHGCMTTQTLKITDVKSYLVAIMSINTDAPDTFMQSLKNSPSARCRCATKWHSKHVAYRCKTCQLTPSSCICVDCFNHSNHEGHDYVIYNSEAGGCCDCGDALAFRMNGFCTRHTGQMNYVLPKGYRAQMYPVLHSVVCNFVYYLVHRDEFAFSKEALHKLGKWLQKLSATHDGVRHLIVEIFLEHSQYSQARPFKPDFLNLFMKPQQYKLPKAIEEILYKLENQKFNANMSNNNDINMSKEDKLLELIEKQISEWRINIEKRIKSVLESIKKGPIWNMHEFIESEKYHGLSHEPLELQILEAPPRKRTKLHIHTHSKHDNDESDEETRTNISSLYDEDSDHSVELDKNIPIKYKDNDMKDNEPEITYMDSNNESVSDVDLDVDMDKYYVLEQKIDTSVNDSDICITKIGKYELKYSDLNNINWNELLPKWLPQYDLEFYHEHIEENYLEDLIRTDAYCDSELTKTLTTLFLELMFDKTFKNVFASTFIKYYFIFTNRIMANPTVLKSLDKITVQILTQKELCFNLVQNHHLLEVLWDSALFLFSSGCPKRVNLTDTKTMIKEVFNGVNDTSVHRTDSCDYWDVCAQDRNEYTLGESENKNNNCKQEKLIRINLTERAEYNGLPLIVMDVTAKAFKDKLGRQVLQDIKFMLTHSACVIEMWKSPEIFEKYWFICGLLHGALPHKRRSAALLEPHKPRDREWQHAVSFDMSMSEVNQYIVDGMDKLYCGETCMNIIELLLVKLKNVISDEPVVMNKYTYLKPQTVFIPLSECENIHRNILNECYNMNITDSTQGFYGKYRVIDYPIAIYPLSIHIPLHRHLASYLKLFYDNDSDRFDTHLTQFLSLKYSVQLMEHPLRCVMFDIQSHTTLWKRNGLEVSYPLQFYRQPSWHCYSYDMDVLLVQLCAMSIASDSHNNMAHIVIETLVNKFNLQNYFNIKRLSRKEWRHCYSIYDTTHGIDEEKLDNFQKIMYEIDEWSHYLSEEFFRFIIYLCSPANSLFMNKSEMIRREMINNLCAGDCTYTHLEEKMSSNLRNEKKIFDHILKEIAVYNKPNHSEQGSYTLKVQCWKEFDTFFYHLRPDILTKAKQRNKGKQLTAWSELDQIIQKYGEKTHPLYPLIGNILYCNKLHSIIYCVLYTAVNETFYAARSHYYNHKLSLMQPIQINNFISLILDKNMFTLKHKIDYSITNQLFDPVPPQKDKTILNLSNIEPILRVIWLAITTDSTHTQQRHKRMQFLEHKSENNHTQFIYPFHSLLREILNGDKELINSICEEELYPPHFPNIFLMNKQTENSNKYLNINYNDICVCLHPSNDILDNLMVLCDGPMSSLLHLLIILKFTNSEHAVTFRIDEIINAINNKSKYHRLLVTKATHQIQEYLNDRENSTAYSEECFEPIKNTNYLLNKKEKKKRYKKAKRMAKAKRKQQALLKKFKAKQRKFDAKPGIKNKKRVSHSNTNHNTCVICCQGQTADSPLGRIVFLQHNLLPKFSRIPDGVADGHIQVLYQYVFDQKIKININELNKVLEKHKIIRIEDFACESKENIIKLFKETFKGRAEESLLEKAAETLHCRAKDLTHAQDRFLGLSHRTPSPVEQLIQLSQRLGSDMSVNIAPNMPQMTRSTSEHTEMDIDDRANVSVLSSQSTLQSITEMKQSESMDVSTVNVCAHNMHKMDLDSGTALPHCTVKQSTDERKEQRTMRCTTRDYYHTAYSLDIDVDRHRTINFEGDGGVQMLSCGHCLHIECYQRFLAHQMSQQNGPQMHPHLHLLDLQREFFCPLCRRLGNALLPISLNIPKHSGDSDHSSDGDMRAMKTNTNNLLTSSSLPTMQELTNMYTNNAANKGEIPALIRDSIEQLINNISRYSPGMQMIPNSHKSIEWLRFTLLFNIRLIENSLRYDSYGPWQSDVDITESVFTLQRMFLNDSRLETLYLLSRVIIFLSNHGEPDTSDKCADNIQLDRIIRGFFATGWVFDTSPLEIATRVLCMNWEYLPRVAEKFDELCLTILLTYMGRIIYFLIRWSRATFDEKNPKCLRFIQYLPRQHFIKFIHSVNIKRFNRHTTHIRNHKSYTKYLRSALRKHKSGECKEEKTEESDTSEEEVWSKEKILSESKWFINSIQWFCLPLLRHLAIMKHIIFKLLYNQNNFGPKIELSQEILSLMDENNTQNSQRKHNVTPSGKKVNDDGLILSQLRIIFEYHSWSEYLLLPNIFEILTSKWNTTHLGTPYSDKHIKSVSRLSPLKQSKLLFCENPYWDKFIPPELLGIFRAPMSPLPFMLKRLPSLYQTLYTTILYKKCNRCQKVPNEAGLCLTCHRLICFRGDCCKNSKHNTFETYDHMMSCGGGLGGVVHLKMGSILLVAHKRRCLWHSLYLDEHGEEDKWLKRGHPLRISPLRFKELEKMFVNGSFVHHNAELWVTDATHY